MYAVNYHRASSVAEAAKLLKNGDAKALSGGMTLIPAMKMRLAAPSDLVDISRLKELKGVKVSGKKVTIGAATTHAEVAADEKLEEGRARGGRSRLADRRPACAPQGHDRRLGRQQRSGGGLSGRAAGAQRHHRHQQARDFGGQVLHRPVRDGAEGRRDHHRGDASPRRRRPLTKSSATRPRATRSPACSSPRARTACASR